jgi:mono/diheme cytochrome c family protein
MKFSTRLLLVLVPAMLATGLLLAHPGDYHNYSGEQLYMRFCASCHGKSGAGDGPVAEAFSTHLPDLRKMAIRSGERFSRDWVYRIVDGQVRIAAHGTQEMPVWGIDFFVEYGADADADAKAKAIISELVDYLIAIQQVPAEAR